MYETYVYECVYVRKRGRENVYECVCVHIRFSHVVKGRGREGKTGGGRARREIGFHYAAQAGP